MTKQELADKIVQYAIEHSIDEMLDLLADIHFHYADQAEDPDIKLAYELAGVQLNKKKFN